MATLAEAGRVIAAELKLPHGRVVQIARRLQENELLPRASGENIPSLDVTHVTSLILALGADTEIRHAPGNVATYGELKTHGLNGALYPTAVADRVISAREFIEDLLLSPISTYADEIHVEFVSTWPEVVALWKGRRWIPFVAPGQDPARWQDTATRKTTTFTGGALHRIASALGLKE